ncbi:MAG TPA: hypothetical protein PLU22_17475 [Polyangiaceae bacterium]|nr:hypothetical protein [Polyangiaceae bacterium]
MRLWHPRSLAAAAALLAGCAIVHEKPADRTPAAANPGAVANAAAAPSSDPSGAAPVAPTAATAPP